MLTEMEQKTISTELLLNRTCYMLIRRLSSLEGETQTGRKTGSKEFSADTSLIVSGAAHQLNHTNIKTMADMFLKLNHYKGTYSCKITRFVIYKQVMKNEIYQLGHNRNIVIQSKETKLPFNSPIVLSYAHLLIEGNARGE